MSDLVFTAQEQGAYDAILKAYEKVGDLMHPEVNGTEFAHGIHILQMIVHQCVLHRLRPDFYSDWSTNT